MNQHKFVKKVIWLVLIPALLLGMLAGCEQMQLSSGDPSTFTTSVAPSSSTVPTSKPTVPTTAPTTVPTEPPTQPTEPPTQPTEPPAPPKPVPEHLRNNYYLTCRDKGACDEMTGKVMIMFVFVNDTDAQWDAEGIKETKTSIEDQMNRLETAAAGYGAKLDMTSLFLNASISESFIEGDEVHEFSLETVYDAMVEVDFEQALENQDILENGFGVDSVPVVFLLNRTGRPFAAQANETYNYMEFAVIFKSTLYAVRHELCHIFGARDFYFPDTTVAAQEKYLPDSLMGYDTYNEVDDLTAYLIGWTDELSEAALQFLEATNHLTREEIEEAQKVS